ncbi:hypothetical protein V8E36_004542 [Tilletia maclaganii]
MFAPPMPAHHPTLAPHHLPLGIHPPASPAPSSPHHGQLHSPSPLSDELLRSTSPGISRPQSRASVDLAEDRSSMPMNAVTKHPKIRLQLNLGADAFEAGGMVHGRMEVASLTGRGMRIGEIAVELEAAEELHSRDHSARQTFLYARTLFQGAHLPPSNAVTPHAPITTSSHTHSGTTVWWAARKGKTTFPFSFPVPIRSPSAVQFAGNASLRYVLKGTAQIWIATPTSSAAASASPHDHQHQQRHLITVRAEVPVVEKWPLALVRSLPTHPLFFEAVEAVADTRLFLGGNGAVWLEAGLLSSIFLSGSEIHLRISVRNNTKRHVSGVKVSLARRLNFPVVRSEERDPGGPGSLLRPPAKTHALQGGHGQQPMITEVVSEQHFKTQGGTTSHAGISYEFPPNEETTCVLPVRVPYDLRTVGLGVPCGPEHGGEELAAAAGPGQVHNPKYPAGSGWSGRSLLFEVQVILRVSLPMGALAKDLTVEIPIWVVHPRSVGAEGVKILMEARHLPLQNPLHQVPHGPDGQHPDPRPPRHRQSLDSHSQGYHDVNLQRPHSSAGHHHAPPTPEFGNLSPHVNFAQQQGQPYVPPSSPSPHSLAPLQQYAIERGWSPAPVAAAHQHHQLPSIAAVMPARPASAMDSYRPLPSPQSPAIPSGMMIAIPHTPAPLTFSGAEQASSVNDNQGFVFDPNAPDWRASRMFVSSDASVQQQLGMGVQRSASAAPDVQRSSMRTSPQDVIAFANVAPARQDPPDATVQGRRPSVGSATQPSLSRAASGPLPLPTSAPAHTPPAQYDRPEPPRPSPSPGPNGRQPQKDVAQHKHVPTPPASMLSDSRPSSSNGGSTKVVATPTAQRAPPSPADVYAQLAMHSHSRMLSEVPEEGDDAEEDELEQERVVTRTVPPPVSKTVSTVSLGRAPSRLESQSPAPDRNPTMRDIAALEALADDPASAASSVPPSATPPRRSALETELDRAETPKSHAQAKPAGSSIASVERSDAVPARPRPLGRSSSSMSVGSQGAGLDALESRLSRSVTPLSASKVVLEPKQRAEASRSSIKDSAPPPKSKDIKTVTIQEPAVNRTPASAPAKYGAFLAEESDDEAEEVANVPSVPNKVATVSSVASIPKPVPKVVPDARPIQVLGNIAPTANVAPRRSSADSGGSKDAAATERSRSREDKAAIERERIAQEALARADASRAAKAQSMSSKNTTSTKPPAAEVAASSKPVASRDYSSALRSASRERSLPPAKTASEAEVLLAKRRESLKKVDPLAPPTPSLSVGSPPLGSQRENDQRALGKKAVDRVAGWLSDTASPPVSSLEGIIAPKALEDAKLNPKAVHTFVRRVSAFDMIDAVNSPKTPSTSVLMANRVGSHHQEKQQDNVKTLPVPVPSASSSVKNPHGKTPSATELPTMAELLAASNIQPMDKERDGDSAVGSVNTFKPTARLTGKGGAPALDFSNMLSSGSSVTDANAAEAAPRTKAKTAAAIAAFEIVTGGPRINNDGVTAPKIKPLKKPTTAGVFLNAAASQGVFSSQASSAVSTSAPAPVQHHSELEVPASSSRVHPYSALALRPSRRQSVDFGRRAAVFEGNNGSASQQRSHDEAPSSRHRTRASIDVVRAPRTSEPSPSFNSKALKSPTTSPAVADDQDWIKRFSRSSTGAGPVASNVGSVASVVRPQPGAALPSAASKLGAPPSRDPTTVDGRGTTKAIGANRLRELRSVWGS